MCIWHLTAHASPHRYAVSSLTMADLAITSLVFPLPDPENAMAPLGGRSPATAAWDRLQLSIPGSVRCWSVRRRSGAMATCEVCGNDYDKAFQVTVAGATPYL